MAEALPAQALGWCSRERFSVHVLHAQPLSNLLRTESKKATHDKRERKTKQERERERKF